MNYMAKAGSVMTKEYIIHSFCMITKTSIEQLKSKSRKTEIVQLRQILMWLLRTIDDRIPYRTVAEIVNRNHSTAVVSKQKIDNFISINDQTGIRAQELLKQIQQI